MPRLAAPAGEAEQAVDELVGRWPGAAEQRGQAEVVEPAQDDDVRGLGDAEHVAVEPIRHPAGAGRVGRA